MREQDHRRITCPEAPATGRRDEPVEFALGQKVAPATLMSVNDAGGSRLSTFDNLPVDDDLDRVFKLRDFGMFDRSPLTDWAFCQNSTD